MPHFRFNTRKGYHGLLAELYQGGGEAIIKWCQTYASEEECLAAMFLAGYSGDFDLVCELVDMFGLDPNTKNSDGESLLHVAAEGGHLKTIIALYEKFGMDPKEVDSFGWTLLHSCAMYGQFDTLSGLVETFGLDPTAKVISGASILHLAAFTGATSSVRALAYQYHLDPKAIENDGESLLFWAARGGHAQAAIDLATEYDLDPHVKNKKGKTIMHCARDLETAFVLAEHFNLCIGAVDGKGVTIFQRAAKHINYEDMVKYTNDFELADINALDDDGWGLLHWAARGGNTDLITRLVDTFQLNIFAKTSMGENVLHCAASRGHTRCIVNLHKKYGFDPGATDNNDWSVVHTALVCGHARTALNLARYFQINLLAPIKDDLTIWHLAARSCKPDTLHDLIMKYGIDIEIMSQIAETEAMEPNVKTYLDNLIKLFHALDTVDSDAVQACFESCDIQLKHKLTRWALYFAYQEARHDIATLVIRLGIPYEAWRILPVDKNGIYNTKSYGKYYRFLAQCDIPNALLELLEYPNEIKAMAEEGQSKEDDYARKDRSIIMHALIGGNLQAGPGTEIVLSNIEIGEPEGDTQVKRTRQLILKYAISLGDNDVVRVYTQLLLGEETGLSGGIHSESAQHPNIIDSLLFDLLDKHKFLIAEHAALKEQIAKQDSHDDHVPRVIFSPKTLAKASLTNDQPEPRRSERLRVKPQLRPGLIQTSKLAP